MAASSSSTDDVFEIGSLLDGRYRVEAVLGTGGMGRVYRAEHIKIGRSVAIKVLHGDLTRNREATQRFQREAIASGRLDHPNIVGVSDFGVLDTGACYLVMEVLEGESLGDRLARDKRIDWLDAIGVLRGVLHGLRHAHDRGVVHRDIKPDNVYLAHKDGEPVIKILDFGIAKLYAGGEDDPASTRAGLTVGTPAYLSPEQAVGGEITPTSDLYSATVVLYEMLAGRAPFEDKDPLAMLGAHISRPPPRFADIAPGVEIPSPLEDIVQRGLRKLPGDRIATATDYLALIDGFSPPPKPNARSASAALAASEAAAQVTSRAQSAQRISGGLALPRSASGTPAAPGMSEPAARVSGGLAQPRSASGTPAAAGMSEPAAARVSAGLPQPIAAAEPAVSDAAPGPAAPGGLALLDGVRPPTGQDAAATRRPPTKSDGLPTQILAGAQAVHRVSVEMAQLPRAAAAVVFADDGDPIPLTWIVRSGVVIGFVIIAAIALSIGAHCRGSASSAADTASVPAASSAPAGPGSSPAASPRAAAAPPGTGPLVGSGSAELPRQDAPAPPPRGTASPGVRPDPASLAPSAPAGEAGSATSRSVPAPALPRPAAPPARSPPAAGKPTAPSGASRKPGGH